MHDLGLIKDLAIVLICAAVVSFIFHRLKWPVFLGYILSGLLVGPNFLEQSPISDLHNIEKLSTLGVIFLMFYIGMEFDLKRLKAVFLPAFLAVFLQTAVMFFLGLQLAPMLGGGFLYGLFLGSLLAISSSMVTVSVLRDLGRMRKPHAQIAVGILIFEDILAIMLLVVLSGVAISDSVSLASISKVTFFISVFVVVVYFIGKLLAPRVLEVLHRIGSMELITLMAVAFMLLVSVLAVEFHFSEALGAFLAGSILANSKLIHEIEKAVEPLRDVFTAVFFVAIGILIEPAVMVSSWKMILSLGVLVVLVKTGSVWLGLVLGGQKPDTSFRAAVSKAQIGEFSFIIVQLAIMLEVAEKSLMTKAVGISVFSAVFALILTVKVEPVFAGLAKRMPAPLVALEKYYRSLLEGVRMRVGRNVMFKLIQRPVLQITFNILLVSGIVIGAFFAVRGLQDFEQLNSYRDWVATGVWLVAAILILPFGTAVVRNINAIVMILAEAAFANVGVFQQMHGRLRNFIHGLVTAGVLVVIAAFYFSMAASYLPTGIALTGFLVVSTVAIVFFWRGILRFNSRLESMFMASLNEHLEDEEVTRRERAMLDIAKKYPWPVSVREVVLDSMSVACGLQIRGLDVREQTGATIIGISRGGQTKYDPDPDMLLFPLDRLFLFGDDAQTERAREIITQRREKPLDSDKRTLQIEQVFLTQQSELVEHSFASAGLRNRLGITVLGVQRGERRITAPGPDFIMEAGDVLFVVGNKDSIERLKNPEQADEAVDDSVAAR